MAGFTPSIYRGYTGSWEDSRHAKDLGLSPVVIFGEVVLGLRLAGLMSRMSGAIAVYGADEEDR
jgi:hypothetical protein